MTGAELELSPPLPANLATAVSIITASTTAVADAATGAAASTAAHVSLSVVCTSCTRVSADVQRSSARDTLWTSARPPTSPLTARK